MPEIWGSLFSFSFLRVLLANLLCITASSSFMMLPVYLERNGLARWQIGLAEAFFWLASVVIQPWLGPRLDRQGRRLFFLSGTLCMAVAVLGYWWVPVAAVPIWTLRALQGGGFAVYVTSSWTWLADRVPPDRVGHYFGVFGLTGMLGGLLGCSLSEWVMLHGGASRLFEMAGGLLLLGFLILLSLHEAVPLVGAEPEAFGENLPSSPVGQACRSSEPAVAWTTFWRCGLATAAGRILALAAFAFGLGVGSIFAFTATYLHGLGLTGISGIFAMVFVVSAAARLAAGVILNRWGPYSLLSPCLVSMALGCALLALLPQLASKTPFFLLAGSLTGVGYGAIYPALKAVAVRTFPGEARGQAISLAKSCIDLGSVCGSLIAGLVATALGYPAMFALVGAVMGVLGWVLAGRLALIRD